MMNRKFLACVVLICSCLDIRPSFPQVHRPTVQDSSSLSATNDILQKYAAASDQVVATRSDATTSLSLFGSDLFNKRMDSGRVRSEVLVLPPNYKLGPGDRVGIFLLGKVQENRDLVVNVEGKVFVPPVGVVHVWGLSLNEFKNNLANRLSQFYDNFNLDVMLLQPKNVLVSVVGEVVRPGKYVLSAMNTVLDAIMLAGGSTPKGSIRDIQLIRDQGVYASVDLYQFLLRGDDKYDEFLQTGDRIFVPFAHNKVTVAGEVRRPAVFELKPGKSERLLDVIELAGGLTDLAFLSKVEISRMDETGRRELVYLNVKEITAGDSSQNRVLRNEDKIHVYSKLEQIHAQTVAIYGEIRKPGVYALEENMRLSDLILKAGNLSRKAYLLEAEIAKIDPGKPTDFVKVSLQGLGNGTNGHFDVELEEDDQVFIRQIPEWEVGLTVEVTGEAMFPGKYAIVKDQTYLSEILQKAGGFTDEAFLQEATVTRRDARLRFDKEFERLREMRREELTDLEYQYLVMRQNSANVNRIVVDFDKLFHEKDLSQDIILEDGDIIVVPKAPKVVSVTGRVASAGGITHVAGADLDYYLAKAGGASWDANLKKAKIIKVTGEVLDDEDVKSFQPGDIIWVPRKSDKKIWPSILQGVAVTAQLASIYLIIDTARNR